jgi:hypothetical protein
VKGGAGSPGLAKKRSRIAKFLQILLLVAMVAAAVRLVFVVRQRLRPAATKTMAKAPPLHREAYVVPRKLHAYDLASARQLTQQPIWVQEGYRYIYYAYDPKYRRADFFRDVGLLGPIEELHVEDVLAQPTPRQPNHHQIVAVFQKNGHSYALPIGTESGGSFQIYADEMFFYEDPRQLYNFWPAEVWEAIGQHQVKPGMNEIQADFAVGMGVPQPAATDPDEKVVKYANGGHHLTVTYRKGRAVKIAEKD